jgi:hypothetical protein
VNREERRRLDRGKKKTATLAGVSLAAASGLFGAYLGNGRIPKAYAAVTCNQTLTFNITSEADYIEAVGIAVADKTFSASTDAITANNHGLVNGDAISFTSQQNTISPALTLETPYYVVNATTNTFQVSQTLGGLPVDITVGGKVWFAPFGSINGNASKDCFVINITSNFPVTADLVNTAKINLDSQLTPKKVTIVGNDKVVTGDPGVPIASFMFMRMPAGVVSEVHISDLTITGMHMDTSYRSAVAQIYAQERGSAYGLVNTFWDDVHLTNNTSGNGWNSLVNQNGEFHISDSTFIGNSVTYPAGYVTGGLFHVFANKNAPAHHSTITDSVFRDNAAVSGSSYALGGAIWNQVSSGSSLTIENSTFDGNSATGVTAAYAGAVSTNVPLVVRESVFMDNTATAPGNVGGGAIGINSGAPGGWGSSGRFGGIKVYDSLFSGNEVTKSGAAVRSAAGGAIFGEDSPLGLRIENSTFHGNAVSGANAVTSGGAVAFDDSSISAVLSIVNSTFSSNSSLVTGSGFGGAILATNKPLSVDFSTITGNTGFNGGGIFAGAGATITNSIVNANTATTGADVSTGGTTISDHSLFTSAGAVSSGTFTQGAGTLFSAAAQVGAVADNGGTVIGAPSDDTVVPTMLPLPGALVLDAGTVTPASGVLPTTDERGTGFPRVEFGLTTMGAVQRLGTPPPPPPPPPVFPPSAPRDVVGAADDGSVAVSWQPPTDSGSFPVTNYLVTAGPGGKTCLATAPALTCTVTGLANGVAYTFVVKALNGAGWGADGGPSAPVTPSAKARSLTLFQGKRAADGRHDRITTGGTSVGVPEGARLTPWIRYGDTGAFVEGVASIVVGSDGGFTWTRQIRKDRKFTAYVAYEDLESNRVTWQRVR